VNASAVVAGLESIELCATKLGRAPDVIVAPGYSKNATVAAAMAQKAAGINGMFRAIAIVDIDTSAAATVANAITAVTANGLNDKNLIVCWPMVQVDDKKQYLSSHMAARIAMTDANQGGYPSRSPSNQMLAPVEGLVVASGTAVEMTIDDANDLEAAGIVTAINYKGQFRSFGNYTGDAAAEDVKDRYISNVRMFAYVNNIVVDKLWDKLDEPLTYRLVDGLVDEINMSLNGLVGLGALHGARAEFLPDENPIDDLQQGIARIHIYICPVAPFMEAVYYIQYDASYVRAAFAALEI
jgi:phage tail sheath protein FI